MSQNMVRNLNIESLTGENYQFCKFRMEIILSEYDVLNYAKAETDIDGLSVEHKNIFMKND